MESDSAELECRVCRAGPEDDRPLYTPCLCSGSIGLVHQDCLEAWLAHSKKDTCELCFSKYQFTPQYAEGAPSTVPPYMMIKTIASLLFMGVVPYTFRVIAAIIIWLLFVPVATTTMYCIVVGRVYSSFEDQNSLVTSIVTGIVIDAVVALSLLILMSFTDFLRFHWIPAQPDQANGVAVPEMNARDIRRARRVRGRMPIRRNINVAHVNHNQAAAAAPAPADVGAAPDAAAAAAGEEGAAPLNRQQAVDRLAAAHEALQRRRDLIADDPNPDLRLQLEQIEQNMQMINQRRESLQAQLEVVENAALNPAWRADQAAGEEEGQPAAPRMEQEDRLAGGDEAPQPAAGGDDGGIALRAAMHVEQQRRLQQQQQQAAVPANVNDDLAIGPEEVQEVGMEIRVALLDMLGIEGPFYVMLRNAAMLLIFSMAYISLMAALPLVLGRKMMHVLTRLLSPYYSAMPPVMRYLVDLCWLVAERSEASKNPLQIVDFIHSGVGYNTVFTAVLLLYGFSSAMSIFQSNRYIASFCNLVSRLAVVVKVGILLVLRIFLLPVMLGSLLLTTVSHTVLQYSQEKWINFMVVNPVGAYSVAWVCGISFMLTMTMSVLQLREVLHPAFLAKLIRPQEAHNELIHSLVQEGGFTHTRRVIVSLAVYILLMALFLVAPLKIYQLCKDAAFPDLRGQPMAINLWYMIPQIQVPLELLICHITFLSILDRRKDLIGHCQHAYLVKVCEWMGLTRFVLPCPLIPSEPKKEIQNSPTEEPVLKFIHEDGFNTSPNASSSSLTVRCFSSDSSGDGSSSSSSSGSTRAAAQEEPAEPRVGPPMVRPPEGWDLRTPNNSSRWAWGTEQMSDVEKSVAPRLAPKMWLPRFLLLCVLSWVLVNSITLFMMIVPISLGRLMFQAAQCPAWLIHDPLCFLTGCLLIHSVFVCLPRPAQFWNFTKQVLGFFRLSPFTLLKMVRIASMWLLTEFSIGFIMTFLRSPNNTTDDDVAILREFSLVTALQIWVKGALILEVTIALLTSQNFGPFFMNRFGLTEALSPWREAVLRVLAEIRTSFTQEDWSLQSLPLDDIEQLVIGPLFSRFVIQGILPCAISFVMGGAISTFYLRLNKNIVDLYIGLCWFSIILCGTWLCRFIVMPAKKWLEALHQKIRDDNYLVGRKLQNNNAAAAASGAAKQKTN